MGTSPRCTQRLSSSRPRAHARAVVCHHRFAISQNPICQQRTWHRWGKKVKGRKRPIATDILGDLLAVIVHAANRADTTEGIRVCMQVVDKYLSIEAFSADAGYRGTTAEWVDEWLNLRVDISDKPPQGFEILPKRWIVERTVACLGGFRRLAKDFEILTRTAENMIRIAMIKVTVAKCV